MISTNDHCRIKNVILSPSNPRVYWLLSFNFKQNVIKREKLLLSLTQIHFSSIIPFLLIWCCLRSFYSKHSPFSLWNGLWYKQYYYQLNIYFMIVYFFGTKNLTRLSLKKIVYCMNSTHYVQPCATKCCAF